MLTRGSPSTSTGTDRGRQPRKRTETALSRRMMPGEGRDSGQPRRGRREAERQPAGFTKKMHGKCRKELRGSTGVLCSGVMKNTTAHTATPITTAYVRATLAVVGFNSEMADLSNPDGAIVREVYQVVAELADGARFVRVQYRDEAKAERLAARVAAAGVIDMNLWQEVEAAYGSSAYLTNLPEEVALERWNDENGRV
jgi:hypothetical protein